jgi:DNA-directed RNA polymerase specialized sigma24 family protein
MAKSDRPSDPPKPPKDDRPPLAPEVIRAFLSSKETILWVNAHVKACVPEQAWEQVAQDALLEALTSEWVPCEEAALRSWLRTITDRVIADFLEKEKSQGRFKGQMPVTPVRTDEAGLPIDDPYDDSVADIDPSVDPRQQTLKVQGFLARRYLDEQTANNPRERLTLEIMLEHFEEDKTYEQIASERELSIDAVNKRVARFESKYADRYEKYRNGVVMLMLLGGAAVVVVAYVVYALFFRAPKLEPIGPEPPPPAPSASAYDPRLDIAEPPAPSVPTPPPFQPGPPGPQGPLKPSTR